MGHVWRNFFSAAIATVTAFATLQSHAAQSDLAIGQSASPTSASINELITWRLNVTNIGSASASSVVITNWFPTNSTFFSATTSQGTVEINAGFIRFVIGTLASGAKASADVVVFSGTNGFLTNRAWTATSSSESQTSNNRSTNIVRVVTGKFQLVGNMNLARMWHTATLLNNGKVLITGGHSTNGNTSTSELFDPATGSFSLTGNTIGGHVLHTSAALTNGKALIVGGIVPASEVYDPATGTWSATSNMIVSRCCWHTETSLNDGRVLVAGGYDNPASAEVYNPVANTWSAVGNLAYPRSSHAAVVLTNGSVLLVGGYGAGTNAEVFSPATNGFAPTGGFLRDRTYEAVVRLTNNTVLQAGGYIGMGDGMMNDAELYNPATKTSVSLGQMATEHWDFSGALLKDGRVLLPGGAGNYNGSYYAVTAIAELFDPGTQTLTPTATMNFPRRNHTVTRLADGRVLITGGFNSTAAGDEILASAEIFDPTNAVTPPMVSIADATALEGNTPATTLTFNLALSTKMGVPVSVNYTLVSGTAEVGTDFPAMSGTIIFPPGITNQTLSVPIGDVAYEPDETFNVALSNPTNAVLARVHSATGTILNDDPIPTVNALSASVLESNLLTSQLTFPVVLSNPSWLQAQVNFVTADVTANAGSDYQATSGVLVFPPGVTTQYVSVTVNGDIQIEPNETLQLVLSSPVNVTLGANGTGTIINDDGLPGGVHHFNLSAISTPQHHSVQFPLTVTARDVSNATAASFNGPVLLRTVSNNVPSFLFDMEHDSETNWLSAITNYPYASSFGFGPYDVTGQGVTTMAMAIVPFYGWSYGVKRDIALVGGVNYTFRFDAAQLNANSDPFFDYVLQVGAATIAQVPMNSLGLPHNQVDRRAISGTFTPPSNGLYTVTILLSAPYSAVYSGVYVDNLRIEPVGVAPPMITLTNGSWTGQVQVDGTGTNLVLQASDFEGHSGLSNPFNVIPAANVVASGLLNLPTPRAFDVCSFNAYVSNLGASPANNVVLTNVLPPGFNLISATAVNGQSTIVGNTIVATFSNLPPSSSAFVIINAKCGPVGSFTNHVSVAANEFDSNLVNNVADLVIDVQPPRLSVLGTTVTETPGGTNAIVTFQLSSSNNVSVSADFATVDDTAVSGADYIATNGAIVFAPGETIQSVAITILDDALDESSEAFQMQVGNFTNCVSGSPAFGVVTIEDDDPAPTLTINDTSVIEGDSGQTGLAFTVTLSSPSGKAVVVGYTTADGTAQAGSDYDFGYGSAQFAVGQTNLNIPLAVLGNTVNEPDETFFLRLTNVLNATAVRTQAVCTIINDDAVPGKFDHFAFDPILPTRVVSLPFRITVRAADYLGAPFTNFNGSAQLTATNWPNPGLASVTPFTLSNFVSGVWTGSVTMLNAVINANLRVRDNAEHVGLGNPFNVVSSLPFVVSLPSAATEGNGVLPGAGAIRATFTNDVDATFALSSNNTNALLVPPTVLLPAGQTNATFDLTVVDDALLNGSRTVSVTATAPTYATNSASMKIHDNESATLSLTMPASVAEKSSNPQATLTVSAPPATNVTVTLTSSDTTEITVPVSVTLGTGQTSTVFTLTVVDDTLIDGPQNATITAHVENWADGVGTIIVLDNETTNLSLFTSGQFPAEPSVREGSGILTNFMRVQLSGTLLTNLTVNLTSSDATELIVPVSVTILSGQTSSNFNVTVPDDSEFDGTQRVAIVASAIGFRPATNMVTVTDNDIHHLVLSRITSPKTGGLAFGITVAARDVNDVNMLGIIYPITLSAVGDHGPVTISPTNATIDGRNSLTLALNSWDTNVRVTLTTTNGANGTSNPFDVSAPAIQVFSLPVTDLAYDRLSGKIFATIGANGGSRSNSLTEIDPVHGVTGNSFPIGDSPDRVVIGDLGQFAYVSVPASNSVRRFNLTTKAVDLEIPLGSGLAAEDMDVQPGNPGVLAVTRRQIGVEPHFAGLVIYDNGVARSNILTHASSNNFAANVIEFGGTPARLYGYEYETANTGFSRLIVDAGGVRIENMNTFLSVFGPDFRYGGGLVYSTFAATVYNAESGAFAASYPLFGTVCTDSEAGRGYYLREIVTGTLELDSATPPDISAVTTISGVIGSVAKMIRCGDSGIAFSTIYNQVFVVRSSAITDTDGDGIPDSWERQFFGSTTNSAGAVNADADGDGFTTLQEWQSGTNPTNATSGLRFSSARASGGSIVLEFPTVLGKRYQINFATNLPPVWQILQQDITGNDSKRSVSVGITSPKQFFRIQLQP